LRQRKQELQRLLGDAVFRIIEIDLRRFEGEPLAPLRVLSKQLAQMQLVDFAGMRFERGPGRQSTRTSYQFFDRGL
jgi:hypothetical protein